MSDATSKFIALVIAIGLPLGMQTALINYRAAHQMAYIPDWYLALTLVTGFGCLAWAFSRRVVLAVIYFPAMLYLSFRWLSWFLFRVYGIS